MDRPDERKSSPRDPAGGPETRSADPMSRAFAEARAAAARGEVPVGAAVVSRGQVIAAAGNRPRELKDPSAHAELLAIRQACAVVGDERLSDCDLYVTLEPCTMCAAAISFARIRRLYFGAADPKGGAVESGVRFFGQPTCHHAPEVYGGIRETRGRRPPAGLLRRAALWPLNGRRGTRARPPGSRRVLLGDEMAGWDADAR